MQTVVNKDYFVQQRSILSRLLPLLVLLSFIWLNLYDNIHSFPIYSALGESGMGIFVIVIDGVIAYLVFELLFYIYRLCIGFSIYSFLIPKRVLIDSFRLWYLIRNIALGFIFNIRFFAPYFATYLCVFEVLLDFLFIFGLYWQLSRSYVDALVGQFVFRSLTIPIILYSVYQVLSLVLGVI